MQCALLKRCEDRWGAYGWEPETALVLYMPGSELSSQLKLQKEDDWSQALV